MIKTIKAIHKNEQRYKCYFCPYKVEVRKDLTNHLSVHFKEEKYKCEICNHVARKRGKLMEHIQTMHDGTR